VHYGRGRDEAESLVSEIRGAGGYAEAVAAALAAADGAHMLAEKVRKIVDGKLDILVANAGISKSVPIEGQAWSEPSSWTSSPRHARRGRGG
jgi:NAD(P)-dependent dehydrogenase (short-subunit alcohol dehydrogenase family)